MIVKNESKIITRLFDSVLPIIDTYCICDTGSTDDTINVIKNYFDGKNITGKVICESFKNFCYNRNYALKSCVGMSDYVLLLDADMILELNNFDKDCLKRADSFNILQGSESFHYQNMRIIKNDGLYNYVGVTHEYIDIPPNHTTSHLEKKYIFIRDVGDGGSKADKFQRDIKLLTEGIINEPQNSTRYHFYLANSYHDTGLYERAIEYYKKRIELGGWKEEVWYSYYRIGLCYHKLNKFSEALESWLNGYNYYPERLEGIYEILKHYRFFSKYELCKLFYNIAKEILNKKLDRHHYLFLQNDVYTHKIDFEYSIFSYYIGIKNIDNNIINIMNHSNDSNELNLLLSNMKFYKTILNTQAEHIYNMSNKIEVFIKDKMRSFNSSSSCLIPYYDGYLTNVRYVNYNIDNNGNYNDCDDYIISLNQLIYFDKNFNVKDKILFELVFDDRRYIGIEDVKIYNDNYEKYIKFIGTYFNKNNKITIAGGNYDIINMSMNPIEYTQTFKHTHCEKNWVYVDFKGETHIIYEWSPLKICTLNKETQELSIVEEKKMPKYFDRVRGSTCGFKTTHGEIWFINHIVSYESPREYYHLISVFDENMNLLRYSAPFKFEGEPIEYCLSIVVEEQRVIINYSTWDRTTKIGVYNKEFINSLVKYIN
jgi:tetratricopeptide (TPR) repeat protein